MTNNKTVLARNTVSGVVGEVPASYLTHPHFSKQLEKVEPGAKDALPELFHPTLDGIDLETGKPKTKAQAKTEEKAIEDAPTSDPEKR